MESKRQIIDLPMEVCLRIFSMLALKDLLNVADSNKTLRIHAKEDLRIKGKIRYLRISQLRKNRFLSTIAIRSKIVEITGIKLGVQFMRLFADNIKVLEINFLGSLEQKSIRCMMFASIYLHQDLEKIILKYITYELV